MSELIAVHAIIVSDPTREMEVAGFDKHGEPIIRKPSIKVNPGSTFTLDDEDEVARLIALGAAHRLGEEPVVPGYGGTGGL